MQHLQCCTNNIPQNRLPTGPQHRLVARPRATLAGHGVLVDFNLEVFVLQINSLLYVFLFSQQGPNMQANPTLKGAPLSWH